MKISAFVPFMLSLILLACAGGQTAIRLGPVGVILPDKSQPSENTPKPSASGSFPILASGSYHGEDIPELEKAGWVGLFIKDGQAFTDSVAISVAPVRDTMLDPESGMSGKKISAEPTGARYYIHGLNSGECSLIAQHIGPIFPGNSYSFEYYGRQFSLQATADVIGDDGDFNALRDYQLVLSTTMNGRQEMQVLAATYQFDDARMSVLFIGDLDRDGWPDLILNTSPKYSYSEISLYLSGPADGKDLVKLVATFRATGC